MKHTLSRRIAVLVLTCPLLGLAADDPALWAPYTGPHEAGVDPGTLTGKVMAGYQGWFAAEGDGADLGWRHYAGRGGRFEPGVCTIDLWPDTSELEPNERYVTAFRHADGRPATVYSPVNARSVLRHFEWMRMAGIDGVFLQRFASSLRSPRLRRHRQLVTANVQAGANRTGRVWAMMYDLSGLRRGEIDSVLIPDWKALVDRMQIRRDRAYLHHDGRPVVSVWGLGFGDGRRYGLDECEALLRFLKDDPRYGANCVMVGVPSFWREQRRDAVADPSLPRILALADIVSPWSVGRYRNPQEARRHAAEVIAPDIRACRAQGQLLLPVVFPGFSWHNLKQGGDRPSPLGQIPRLGGRFLWAQAQADIEAGATALYVAMFDEVDEGTAIFKCTNDPPIGDSPFLTYEGLPTDHYLWLTGRIGRVLRGQDPVSAAFPTREKRALNNAP